MTFIFISFYRKVVADAKSDRPYQDLLYNPSYELNGESYQPLRPPRKRDALRKQEEQLQQEKTKTVPSGFHLDDPYSVWHQQDFGAIREPAHNSLHNLMYTGMINARPQTARNGKQAASFIKQREDHDSMYSNGNTMNFRQHQASRSFHNENVRNLINGSPRYIEDPSVSHYADIRDDETHYAVAI